MNPDDAPEHVNCPMCGNPTVGELRVSLETNTAVCSGFAISLWPREAEVLYALCERRSVSNEGLKSVLWGSSDEIPLDCMGQIRVIVHHLRRRIEPLPFRIMNTRFRGYSLVKLDSDQIEK